MVCKKAERGVTRRRFLAHGARSVAGFGVSSLLLSSCGSDGPPTAPEPPGDDGRLLAGAHYYLWFPDAFQGGRYLRARLLPGQQPMLGEYSSALAPVAEQHIAWAAQAGIDFFTLDWWPGFPALNARIDTAFLAARNLNQIRFCVFYELGGLGYDLATGLTFFNETVAQRFLADQEEIATRYFAHPRYLRLGSRPVVIYYITRSAVGLFEDAMGRYRARMEQLGFDPFVIGDEVFWKVARTDNGEFTPEPQRRRIQLFDALMAYNLYNHTITSHAGYGATSALVPDAHALYARYRAEGGRPVIPLAFAGYNDRAVRPEENHYPIPREWSPGAGEGTFLAEWIARFTLPEVDPALPMMLLTSWNEWGEDTAVEPLVVAPPTARDVSGSGEEYTQGFVYAGYGMSYLDILRRAVRGA